MAEKMTNWLPWIELARKLIEFGFMLRDRRRKRKAPEQDTISAAVHSYQAFHGLKPDGWAGPKTTRHMQQPRYCGLPDRMAIGQWDNCRWPFKDPTWTVKGSLPGFLIGDIANVSHVAMDRWTEVCGIKPKYKGNNTKTANIVMNAANLGGPGGTLADSQLPCGNVTRKTSLRQRYDTQERFVYKDGQIQPWEIDLGRTMLHEVGHALGVPHLTGGNLMAPTHSPTVYLPQFGDIGEMTERYGEPGKGGQPVTPAPALKYHNILIRGEVISIHEKVKK